LPKRKILLIALFGTLLAVFWQEYNLYTLNHQFPYSNGLITCADEASYIRPAENLLEKGLWKDNSIGITSWIMRPPGFGIYYLILKVISGKHVFLLMKICQILFYFFSIILVSKILKKLIKKEKVILFSTIIFAFLPCFNGFMYFTITESISPFFTLLSVFYFLKFNESNKQNLFPFVFSSAFVLLIRPQLLLLFLLIFIYFIVKKEFYKFKVSLLILLPFLIWNLRSINIASGWLGIHPIYSKTNNSLYRPSHEKMTNLFRVWEHKGDVFHTSVGILANDTSLIGLNKSLAFVPEKYKTAEVISIFKEFQDLKEYQRQKFTGKDSIVDFYQGEKAFHRHIEKVTSNLISNNRFDYHILTPFHSLRALLLSSHLNLKIFQADFRGNIFMEILRYICVLFIAGMFLISSVAFLQKKIDVISIFSLTIAGTLFYLTYIQRMNEERYVTPLIPLAYILLVVFLAKIKNGDKDTLFGKLFSLLRKQQT
jgi:ABC-type multidrug transport system fused ATPase/permease subunit